MENVALIGLSRQVALRRELDVIANNIANLNTTGFKADDVVFQEFISPVAREERFRPGADQRVSMVWDRASWHNLANGPLDQTGSPLDVAISGRGFFAVETPTGERLTRNGSFEIDAQNRLVTKQGHAVLGEGGPIRLEPGDTEVTIAKDGTVSTRNGVRGRIRLMDAANPRAIEKQGDNLFRTVDAAAVTPLQSPDVRQGYVERSNVRPVVEISRMIEVNRAYSSLSSMIERHDQIRRDAIRALGDVSR